MHRAGRRDAGIFLLGLLAHSGDNWRVRTTIVERLEGFNTKGCADFLIGELRRVKGDNTTRRYLAAVLDVLAGMPLELIQSGLCALIADGVSSQRMRDRFMEVLVRGSLREWE